MKEKKKIKDDVSLKIIESAATIIQNEGVTSLSVSKILKELNVSNRVFYNRFNNVDEVLREVYNNIIIQKRVYFNPDFNGEQDFFEYVLDLCTNSLEISYELKTKLNLYIFGNDSVSQTNYEWYIGKIKRLVEYAKEKDLVIDVDSDVISYTIWCAIRGYNADVITRLNKEEAIKNMRYSFNLLLKGIKK